MSESIANMLWLFMCSSRSMLLITQASSELIMVLYSLYVDHQVLLSNCTYRGGTHRRVYVVTVSVVLIAPVIAKQVFLCILVSFACASFVGSWSTTTQNNKWPLALWPSHTVSVFVLGTFSRIYYRFCGKFTGKNVACGFSFINKSFSFLFCIWLFLSI